MADIGFRLARFRGNVDFMDLLFVLLLISVALQADALAYGSADEKGIVFRRYVKRHFVPWHEVARVEWEPRSTGLRILLKEGLAFRRKLQFFLDGSVSVAEAIREFTRRTTPEIVLWLQEQIHSHRMGAQ
jgi:hypothetical protein